MVDQRLRILPAPIRMEKHSSVVYASVAARPDCQCEGLSRADWVRTAVPDKTAGYQHHGRHGPVVMTVADNAGLADTGCSTTTNPAGCVRSRAVDGSRLERATDTEKRGPALGRRGYHRSTTTLSVPAQERTETPERRSRW